MNTSAIIFHYNRPSKIYLILEQLKKSTPLYKYYFFSDGPATEADKPKVRKCRELVRKYFPNAVFKEYDTNQTYRYHFIDDIKNVFQYQEAAIILEDDCFFDNTFIDTSLHILNNYKDDKSIFCFKGYNNLIDVNEDCYLKTNLFLPPWGWATWKRSINSLIDFRKKNLFNVLLLKKLEKQAKNDTIKNYYKECETLIKYFTWDNHVNLTIQVTKQYVLLPGKNLIKNIGYDNEATGTFPAPGVLKYSNNKIYNDFNYKTTIIKDMNSINESNLAEIMLDHKYALNI